ncbi:tellurite resistance TerB family protein, partial [Photobacterium sanctipauli]
MKSMMDKLLNQASKYMEGGSSKSGSSSDLLKGAVGGGLVGTLLGNKKSRKLAKKYGKKAAVVGGTALVGTLAYQAYKKYQHDQPESGGDAAEPAQLEQASSKDGLLIQAMVFAAKSDGHIDDSERAAITNWMHEQQLDHDTESCIQRWIDEPLDPSVISAQVENMAQASEVYLVSLLAIDVDHFL